MIRDSTSSFRGGDAGTTEPIAIVGMGGVFPGASSLAEFWQLIAQGRDACGPVPNGRWQLDPAQIRSSVAGLPDRVLTDRGCFIEGFEPDWAATGLPRQIAQSLDPAFHLLIAAGHAAFAQAHTETLDRSRVGVIIGSIALPTAGASALCDEVLAPLLAGGQHARGGAHGALMANPLNRYATGLPSGLLASSLGLGGTSFGLDAACASSLYAIKLACDELREHRASAMLAGGLSRPDSLYTQMGFSQLRALSPSGRCSPFDAKGDGLIVGEGAGMVVLKRLADALHDGDRILAVIRGAGLSNDTEGNLLSPSSEGQSRALQAAYTQAGWSPDMVDLIECHATGTPVGDAVEFASLTQLWKGHAWREGQCVLGAIKSNVGHLLTAAGSAGLIKTLLALQHDTLPPTANFEQPSKNVPLAGSPFCVLREGRPWARRADGVPRRAAINGFGFGGINAHLLIEEWIGDQPNGSQSGSPPRSVPKAQSPGAEARPDPVSPENEEPIAIVGMGVRVGRWNNLQSFGQRVLDSDSAEQPAVRAQWRGLGNAQIGQVWGNAADPAAPLFPGYFLDDLSVPLNRFHIPPRELAEMLPQQLLMLDVARSALDDAGNPVFDPARAGVFIGLGLDLRTTDFHFRWTAIKQAAGSAGLVGSTAEQSPAAPQDEKRFDGAGLPLTPDRTLGALGGIVASRIAREFRIGGQSHAICSEETSGLQALAVAVAALRRGELDVAVTGAVDLCGDLRALVAADAKRPYARAGNARPFDVAAQGAIPGEGAACVILKRLADAQRDGDRVYAVVRGVGVGQGVTGQAAEPDATAYTHALQRAYADAHVAPESVQLLESHGSGYPAEDRMEASALAAFFGSPVRGRACHISSAKADVGHTGAASGLVSLIKASLSLHHQVIPGLRDTPSPRPELSASASLSVPRAARHWVRNRADGPRRAGVSVIGSGGACAHAVLEGHEQSTLPDPPPSLIMPSDSLFLVSAHSATALLAALGELEQLAQAQLVQGVQGVQGQADASPAPLAQHWWRSQHGAPGPYRVALLARNVSQLLRLIRTAAGPATQDARRDSEDHERVIRGEAPVSGAPGRVAFVFPGSGNQFENMGRELARQWPQVLRAQDAQNQRLASQLQADQFWSGPLTPALLADHRALISAQVTFGTMIADLAGGFGLSPTAAIGYSLGESTALFATRAWRQRDAMLDRLAASSLFAHDLAGQPDVLRQAWGLPQNQSVAWVTGMVDRSAEQVRAAIGNRQRIYLLIINTADECVIGGDRVVVEDLVAQLGCHWFALQGVSTVHCELAQPVRKAYRQLHHFETTPPADIEFYSCAWGRAYTPDAESAADAIEAQALGTVDFPRVIRAAYAAGVHTFIEMGPGNSCSRMIGKILKDRPHVARSLATAGAAPVTHFLRTIGQLYVAGIPVKLDMLYGGADLQRKQAAVEAASGAGKHIVVSMTGAPLSAQHASVPELHVAAPVPAAVSTMVNGLSAGVRHTDSAASRAGVLQSPDSAHFADVLLRSATEAERATVAAHQAYLRFSDGLATSLAQAVEAQVGLLRRAAHQGLVLAEHGSVARSSAATPPPPIAGAPYLDDAGEAAPGGFDGVPRSLDRAACLEFGRGQVGRVLGSRFAPADAFPTRVRLPDEPLMLVDRIVHIEGEPLSMSHGRVVTEHDIHAGAWYLDCGHIPTCIAVEAGQADLFLSGYLGIDFETRGRSVYRLLDAKVCFHGGLPGAGKVIRYDIRITHFFRQSDTWLFKFSFEATVDGQPLLTMTDGCAGFFSQQELAAGKGIVRTALDLKPLPGKRPPDWVDLVTMGTETYNARQLDALRAGDLVACFGDRFAQVAGKRIATIPDGRMKLVHRIVHLDPVGGRFGLGMVRGEADVHPQDWFLTCHFVDDQVMPGTLMFECCLHTLRVYLLRMGWLAEEGQVSLEPVPGIASGLKCRGQVLATTRIVTYEVSIKEIGYGPEPYVIADALMYADGKPIVDITNMSLRYGGVSRQMVEAIWRAADASPAVPAKKPAIYTYEQIHAFAVGKPSDAFGPAYRIFDSGRVIARLPGPPFQFMDRVTEVRAEPWKIVAGGEVESQYDVPPDAWYFADNGQGAHGDMPFAVLLEIALQPCGWLAAYMGSALTSEVDVSFRNLGGTATQIAVVQPHTGTLTVRVKLTRASSSAGMIIQFFDYEVRAGRQVVYQGDTYFGFFPKVALEKQEGLKDAKRYLPGEQELARGRTLPFPEGAPYPGGRMRMLDEIACWVADGGPKGLGFIRGTRRVRRDEWFFKAHFYQDPVVPGSLGLESFLQLLKFVAIERWGHLVGTMLEAVALNERHQWTYRGQVIPADGEVTVEAVVTTIDDTSHLLRADGYLSVDGRVIYAMQDFTVRQRKV